MRDKLDRLVFIDETSLNTKMTKTTGWSQVGTRLRADTLHGHWFTQTFIAGLRHNEIIAPWVIDAPMNKQLFEIYTKTQLSPCLQRQTVVVLDNLSSHKSSVAAECLKNVGAWFLFLPPYSPDLNPIEMLFSKIKTLMRKAAVRSYDDLWKAVGNICDLVTDEECYNYFKAAGYEGK